MSLDVEVETLEEHWYAGNLMKVGSVYTLSPSRALKLVNRGRVKKIGVAESEQAEEPVEEEETVEVESEGEVEENDSSEEDEN